MTLEAHWQQIRETTLLQDQMFEEHLELGKEVLSNIWNTFLKSAEDQISLLHQAMADHSPERWQEAAHSYKGMAGNLGLARAFEAAELLIKSSHDPKSWGMLLAHFVDIHKQSVQAFEASLLEASSQT